MQMHYKDEITQIDNMVDAVIAFRKDNGRLWKYKLRSLFRDANNKCPNLQRFRNKGFSILKKIKDHTPRRTIKNLLLKQIAKDNLELQIYDLQESLAYDSLDENEREQLEEEIDFAYEQLESCS